MADHSWLEALKRFLQFENPDQAATEDDLLNWCLQGQTAACNRYAGFICLDPGSDKTVYRDGGLDSVWVPPPILSVTTVHDDPWASWGADSLVPATDYRSFAGEGRVMLNFGSTWGSYFRNGRKTVKVVYRPGLAADNEEYAHIQGAVIQWAAKLFKDSEKKLHNVRATSSAAGNITFFEKEMPKEVKQKLDTVKTYAVAGAS